MLHTLVLSVTKLISTSLAGTTIGEEYFRKIPDVPSPLHFKMLKPKVQERKDRQTLLKAERRENIKGSELPKKETKCTSHPTNTAEQFCENCDLPVCGECVLSKIHILHSVVDIKGKKGDVSSIHEERDEGKQVKTTSGEIKGRERTSNLLLFTKQVKHLKNEGEYEIQIQRLINSMNIEKTYKMQGPDHKKKSEFESVIDRIGYLDCIGLHFSDDEKLIETFKPFHSSIEEFLEWMKGCGEVIRKTMIAKCRLVLAILLSAYTKKALDGFATRHITLIIDRCIDFATEYENYILVVELVRSYMFDFDFHLQNLSEVKKIQPAVIETLLQTAKFMFLRRCPGLRQNAISLSLCCECSQEKRLVIMMLYKGEIEIKYKIPEKAMGVKLVLQNYTKPSDEANDVFNSFSVSSFSKELPVITKSDARKLFNNHSNITLISASPFKSSGYSKGRQTVVEKECISLLCLHKGFIPFGEKEFPKQINGFDVDVQEGYCSLGSGRSIDYGGHIRRARGLNTPGNGSIGGFVDLGNNRVGLITCAHAVFSSDELKTPRNELKDTLDKGTGFEVEAFDKKRHNFKVFGRIVDICFSDVVDAALIKLDPTVNEFRFRATSADQLLTAGFDPQCPPIFNGDVVLDEDLFQRRIPGNFDSVIKYGSKTGFTIGNLYPNPAHIRFVNDDGDLPDKTQHAMFHQIEVQSLPLGTFFEPGDSGAFVFCINPDKTLSCLGMAIGSTSRGSCLITPIVRILRSFDLPDTGSLKPCTSNVV